MSEPDTYHCPQEIANAYDGVVIYEASFFGNGVFVSAGILERKRNGWVKAAKSS